MHLERLRDTRGAQRQLIAGSSNQRVSPTTDEARLRLDAVVASTNNCSEAMDQGPTKRQKTAEDVLKPLGDDQIKSKNEEYATAAP